MDYKTRLKNLFEFTRKLQVQFIEEAQQTNDLAKIEIAHVKCDKIAAVEAMIETILLSHKNALNKVKRQSLELEELRIELAEAKGMYNSALLRIMKTEKNGL